MLPTQVLNISRTVGYSLSGHLLECHITLRRFLDSLQSKFPLFELVTIVYFTLNYWYLLSVLMDFSAQVLSRNCTLQRTVSADRLKQSTVRGDDWEPIHSPFNFFPEQHKKYVACSAPALLGSIPPFFSAIH